MSKAGRAGPDVSTRWLIIADDLTGAADCAIAFARCGFASRVLWGATRTQDDVPVVSYNADSREIGAQGAVRRQMSALDRLHTTDRVLFKKIDSTLRGHPAAETAAAMALLTGRFGRAFAVLAPAFPAAGRTVVGAHVQVGGVPLEESEIWRRGHAGASANLVGMLASSGLGAAHVDLATVRRAAGPALQAIAASGGVAVCDAETDQDLELIARAALAVDMPGRFFIGSAGLAHALARLGRSSASEPPVPPRSRYGTLIVVGSTSSVSRASAERLVSSGDALRLSAAPRMLMEGAPSHRAAFVEQVAATLSAGRDALVEIGMGDEPPCADGPALAAALASVLAPARPFLGALAATGGETAAALMGALGIDGLHLVEEIEPGVPLGLSLGQITIPVATKAGAFGNEGTLSAIAGRLRAVRLKGSFS